MVSGRAPRRSGTGLTNPPVTSHASPSSVPSSDEEARAGIAFRDYANESKLAWSDFVEKCDEAWLGHLPEFIDVEGASRNWINKSFSIRNGQLLIGVCVLGIVRSGAGRILSGAGPAILPESKSKRLLRMLEGELLRRAREAKCCAIHFALSPGGPGMWQERYVNSYLSVFDFSYGARSFTPDYEGGYYIISDLDRSEDKILASFASGQKPLVKKCIRAGLVVRRIDPIDDERWSEFVAMYRAMCARRMAVPWGAEWLGFLRRQAERGRYMLFNSYHQGKVCASILLSSYKRWTYYYAAGCTAEALSLGAMAHLHFEAMKITKQLGFKYYCLGYTIPSIRKTETGRIFEFKDHLGGNERWDMLSGEWILDRQRYYATVLLPKLVAAQILMVPGTKSFAKAARRVLSMLKARLVLGRTHAS